MEVHPFNTRWREFNWNELDEHRRQAWVVNQEAGYFGFLPSKAVQHLIIGSFPIGESVHYDPPYGNRFDFSFFYCSRLNKFYEILKTITGYEFFLSNPIQGPVQKVISITNFFIKNEVGITDIIYKASRSGNGVEAVDEGLTVHDFNNVFKLLKEYKSIKCIYFTSGNVERWFKEHLRKGTGKKKITKNFFWQSIGRNIQMYSLFSPAPTANTAAEGILNKDEQALGERSMRSLMPLIPYVQNVVDQKTQHRMCQWANGLDKVPDLIRTEIVNNPEFQEIRVRF